MNYFFDDSDRHAIAHYYHNSLIFQKQMIQYLNNPLVIFEHELVWQEQLYTFNQSKKGLYEVIKGKLIYATFKPKLEPLEILTINFHSMNIKSLRPLAYQTKKQSYVKLLCSQLLFENALRKCE